MSKIITPGYEVSKIPGNHRNGYGRGGRGENTQYINCVRGLRLDSVMMVDTTM